MQHRTAIRFVEVAFAILTLTLLALSTHPCNHNAGTGMDSHSVKFDKFVVVKVERVREYP
jgi:hypothetical protein